MKFYTFSHAGGEELLKEKGLLGEITDILEGMKRSQLHSRATPSGHDLIESLFQNTGWEIEKYILPEKNWRWDCYKDRVAISIEFTGGTARARVVHVSEAVQLVLGFGGRGCLRLQSG